MIFFAIFSKLPFTRYNAISGRYFLSSYVSWSIATILHPFSWIPCLLSLGYVHFGYERIGGVYWMVSSPARVLTHIPRVFPRDRSRFSRDLSRVPTKVSFHSSTAWCKGVMPPVFLCYQALSRKPIWIFSVSKNLFCVYISLAPPFP